ncbi:hypothetical protein BCR37DRAFT_394323 [Protomyces lactucae-debilis]|uniref:Uncharacterized protein n=1 Tax=Protomyces lactucae-debilis TaxID=2754530 RepID=A0A1Y2F5P0_PROLT|nr:uncharacterized protein BCR37DRAFT_394323 [Protomyces lactucae-debilis]ORY78967.1 hypothetical protein BCR37DRAFT_394323 [Protomyces lactucae-debilis]
MPLHLLTVTLATSTLVAGDCIVYWQNRPRLAPSSAKAKLIDATSQTLADIYSQLVPSNRIVLHGIDLLLPLKLASAQQIVTAVRALSATKHITVIINADDALRQTDHAFLLQTLLHAAHQITNLRALPSGRDREFAGMARTAAGAMHYESGLPDIKHGERLFRYGEDLTSN